MNLPVEKNKYYYPIVLKNEHLDPFRITSEIELRRITKSEREEFFGLEDVDFTYKTVPGLGYLGFIKFFPSQSKKGRYPYSRLVERGAFDGSDDILASNYVLIIECSGSPNHIIQRLNLSFKLFKPTSTGGYLGFREKETDVHLHYSMPIHGPFDYLSLTAADLAKIQQIFKVIEEKQDNDKFKLLGDLYDRALQGGEVGLDIRFLLLVISLESLYLPAQESELKFRLSIRTAKLLSKLGYGEAKDIFHKVNKIYKIRSQLFHAGKTKGLTFVIFSELTNIVGVSLSLYINNPNDFSEDALTTMVLQA
jgi:hypothetical protein